MSQKVSVDENDAEENKHNNAERDKLNFALFLFTTPAPQKKNRFTIWKKQAEAKSEEKNISALALPSLCVCSDGVGGKTLKFFLRFSRIVVDFSFST